MADLKPASDASKKAKKSNEIIQFAVYGVFGYFYLLLCFFLIKTFGPLGSHALEKVWNLSSDIPQGYIRLGDDGPYAGTPIGLTLLFFMDFCVWSIPVTAIYLYDDKVKNFAVGIPLSQKIVTHFVVSFLFLVSFMIIHLAVVIMLELIGLDSLAKDVQSFIT